MLCTKLNALLQCKTLYMHVLHTKMTLFTYFPWVTADNWPLIDWSPSPIYFCSNLFVFFSHEMPACVCVAPCHAIECDWAHWWGFKGRAGRAGLGLAVFVPAVINAGRKPGNEVSFWFSNLSSPLLSLPGSLPFCLCFRIFLALASVTATSPAGSGMLLSARLIWAISAVGSVSSRCAVWTKR